MTSPSPATPLSPTISVSSIQSVASSTSPTEVPVAQNNSMEWDYFMFDQSNGIHVCICQINVNDVSEALRRPMDIMWM